MSKKIIVLRGTCGNWVFTENISPARNVTMAKQIIGTSKFKGKKIIWLGSWRKVKNEWVRPFMTDCSQRWMGMARII